jgi:hypothetical protein
MALVHFTQKELEKRNANNTGFQQYGQTNMFSAKE